MNKGYIFKLSFRPYTLQQACRVRYYIRVSVQEAVMRAVEDMNLPMERIFLNCEPVIYPTQLDVEYPTVYDELTEISASIKEPVYSIIAGYCGSLQVNAVLNIAVSIYDHNQLILTHEVYTA